MLFFISIAQRGLDPFITSSTMVKMVLRTVALSIIAGTLLVWFFTNFRVLYSSHPLSATRTAINKRRLREVGNRVFEMR